MANPVAAPQAGPSNLVQANIAIQVVAGIFNLIKSVGNFGEWMNPSGPSRLEIAAIKKAEAEAAKSELDLFVYKQRLGLLEKDSGKKPE